MSVDEDEPPVSGFQPVSLDEAFRALTGSALPPRDSAGRFKAEGASEEGGEEPNRDNAALEGAEQETEAAEPEGEAVEGEAEQAEADEAPDEGQPEDDVPLPVSWKAEDADLWKALPADAKAKIFAREAQREQAVNSKFQEAAQARQAAEAQARAAAEARQTALQELELAAAVIRPQRPDPALLDEDSDRYNPALYRRQQAEFEHAQELLGELQQRMQVIAAQQEAQERAAWEQREMQYRPALLQAVPDLADPQKGPVIAAELRDYGVKAAIPVEALETAHANELLVLWKAMQWDKQQQAAQRVKAVAPKPQQSAPKVPPVRPGVSQPPGASARGRVAEALRQHAALGTLDSGYAALKALEQRR